MKCLKIVNLLILFSQHCNNYSARHPDEQKNCLFAQDSLSVRTYGLYPAVLSGFKGWTACLVTNTGIWPGNTDFFGLTAVIFIVDTVTCLALNIYGRIFFMAAAAVDSVFSPLLEIIAAGFRLCFGINAAYANMIYTAIRTFIVHTVFCITF